MKIAGDLTHDLTVSDIAISKKVEKIFISFIAELKKISPTDSPLERIKTIVALIQDLERGHYFMDRNCMTAYVLLMDLVIAEGLPPPMLANVNYLDGCSVQEGVEAVLEGMETTLHLVSHPNEEQNGISTKENLLTYSPRTTTILSKKQVSNFIEMRKTLQSAPQKIATIQSTNFSPYGKQYVGAA